MRDLEALHAAAEKAHGPWPIDRVMWTVEGHRVFVCGPHTGHSFRAAAFCETDELAEFYFHANPTVILSLLAERDRLLRAVEAARELLEVAQLRGDNELPHPADDPKLWTARMQDAWGEIEETLAALTAKEPADAQ